MLKYHTTFRPHSEVVERSGTGRHIVVIGAGMSSEREVSLSSSEVVIQSLIRLGYKVTFVDMGVDIATTLTAINPDIVFNCLHGTYGEDGCLPGLLNILRIPYTHCGVLASATAFNKIKAKELFVANGILTAKHVIINKSDKVIVDPMPRPYVIKPMNQGSSIGIELVFPEDNFNFANYDFPYGDTIIVEEYIKGREVQVAVLNSKAIGTLELKLLKSRFHDYAAKYTKGFAEHIIPAKLSNTHYSEVMSLAEKANAAIMGTGIVRVEFIFDELQEKFFILEVNTHPGLTPTSVYPDIAVSVGISVDSLIEQILSSARFEQ